MKATASYEGESASETTKTDIFGDDGFDRFDFGLTKLVDGDGAPKNTNFSIGVGYKF